MAGNIAPFSGGGYYTAGSNGYVSATGGGSIEGGGSAFSGGGGGSYSATPARVAIVGEDSGNCEVTIDLLCFLRGTRIATPRR